MKIRYIGHSTILIESEEVEIVVDPYLRGKGIFEGLSRYNPNAALSIEDFEELGLDLILLTHGHGDHFGQTFELLERTDAKLVASNEVCDFMKTKSVERRRLFRIEPNQKLKIDKLSMLALEAKHKHGLEGFGGDILGLLAYKRYTPCGTNMGFLISVEGKRVYHSGDTYIVRGVRNPDMAFLSMDGFRTLNEKEAMEVIREIKPKIVVPIHYKWLRNGEKTVQKVKEIVEHEEMDILFKEMSYGEVMDV